MLPQRKLETRGEQIKLMREGYWELIGKEMKNSDVVSGVHEKLIGVESSGGKGKLDNDTEFGD